MRNVVRATRTLLAVTLAIALSGCGGAGPAESRAIPASLPEAAREQARLLPFDGTRNFRELGGYRTADGGSIRWGVLFRSAALADLSDADQAYLLRLGVRTVMDFRSEAERLEAPDRLPASIHYVENPVEVDGAAVADLSRRLRSGDLGDLDLGAMLVEGNKQFVLQQTDTYRIFLKQIANSDDLPLVFHCTAGKDRAGFGAALALLAAGVPRETVIDDFLKTNEYTAGYIDRTTWVIRAVSLFRAEPERIRQLLGVERRYIEAALEAIDTRYGGVDSYLREGLGIDEATLAAIRRNLVEY